MAYRTFTTLIRIPVGLLRAAEALGVAPETRRRLPQLRDLSNPDGRVPLSALWAVWRELIERNPDPALGLRLGRRVSVRRIGLVGYAMTASRTLGDALECLSRYYRILREGVDCRIEHEANDATIVLHDHATIGWGIRQQIDARLATILAVCRQLTCHKIAPRAVAFPYGSPPRLDEHRRAFGRAILRFTSPDAALTLAATDLARPIRTADDTLAGYLERLAGDVLAELGWPPAGSFATEVAQALVTTLGSGPARIGGAGSVLGISERTLQRRLRGEGTTFAAVLERVRRQQAERLLRDSRLTVEDVAALLGYSEPSTFYRAFRRWRATTPGAFRARVVTDGA